MAVKVVVHGPRGEKKIIDLCDTEEQFKSITVLQLKRKIRECLLPECPEENMRLISKDRALDEDSALLSKYGVQHMSDILMVIRITGGSSPPGEGDGAMGVKKGRNKSIERLADFQQPGFPNI